MIGPPLPPALSSARQQTPDEQSAATSKSEDGSASTASKRRKVIGPAPPPDVKSQSPILSVSAVGEKRAWHRIREREERDSAAESSTGAEKDRDEWMTVPPSIDRSVSGITARTFSNRSKPSTGNEHTDMWTSVPSYGEEKKQVATALATGRDSEDSEEESDDGIDVERGRALRSKNSKKERGTTPEQGTPLSMLESHRAEAQRDSNAAHLGAFKPWDREKEFVVNHKKKDASAYIDKCGGLSSRYASSSSR